MIKNSYFIPIKIHTVNSTISKSIEVIWSNGGGYGFRKC
jgi:hypothetical protein